MIDFILVILVIWLAVWLGIGFYFAGKTLQYWDWKRDGYIEPNRFLYYGSFVGPFGYFFFKKTKRQK
jgi:hypothetical protein